MARRITLSVMLLVLGQSVLPTTQAQSFIDDFEDGDVTDGNPVSWGRYSYMPEGIWELEDGDFVFRPTPLSTDPTIAGVNAYVEEHVYGDVSLRTQFRALTPSPYWVGFFARAAYSADGENGTEIFTHVNVQDGGTASIGYNRDDETHDDLVYLGHAPFSFSAYDTDVNLRLDVSGSNIEFYAWPDGEDMPATPTVSATAFDFLAPEGDVGIWYQTWASMGGPPVAFRYFEVVPEPSTGVLAGIALLGLASLRRRRST